MSNLNDDENDSAAEQPVSLVLTLAALGVVFGDIGTSPLYALRECLSSVTISPEHILGVLSLIFWSLTIVISFKYVLFIMRADNRGEGGVLALMALAQPHYNLVMGTWRKYIVFTGIFGAALLYGDGIITPAISVLSAIEGLTVATPFFEPYVIPLTLGILVMLFLVQRRGTAKLGAFFGPIMLLWFVTLGVLGIISILNEPSVIYAINPGYALALFFDNPLQGFLVLGSVFLAVTGGEALYADMGHFGRDPLRVGWFFVAFPGLILNYFGQGALLLQNPAARENPFYLLAPTWMLYPLVALATMATVIASQAVISGAFSITGQAIKLGLLPRITIHHTSQEEFGQIYVSRVNWALLIATIFLVLSFGTSSKLASAYGIAVSSLMIITTGLIFFTAQRIWDWSIGKAALVILPFVLVDSAFFFSNLSKIKDGGWFPLVVALAIFTLMTTWRRGRQILRERLREKLPLVKDFVEDLPNTSPLRVPGTAIYMNMDRDITPPALVYNLKHNKVVHDLILIVSVHFEEVPYVPASERIELEEAGKGIYRVTIRYGFMNTLNIPRALLLCKEQGLDFDVTSATFFLGRETLLATERPGMAIWRESIFAFLSRNAQKAAGFFGIKATQVVEIGFEVEL